MHLGLDPFWAVIMFIVIIIFIIYIIIQTCKNNDKTTNREVLWDILVNSTSQTHSIVLDEVFNTTKSDRLDEETYYIMFEWLFSEMSLEELKKLKITTSKKDTFNKRQDVDDIRRCVLEKRTILKK